MSTSNILKKYIEKKRKETNLSPSKIEQLINLEKILERQYNNNQKQSSLVNIDDNKTLENDKLGVDPLNLKNHLLSDWLSESNENFALILSLDKNKILLLKKNYFTNPNVRDIFLECILEKQQLLVNETYKSKNIFVSLKYLTSKNLIVPQDDFKKLLKKNNILELSERYDSEFISRELLQLSQFGLTKQKTDNNLDKEQQIKQKYIDKKNIPYKKDVYFEEILSKALLNYSFQWDAAINNYLRYGETYFSSNIFKLYFKRFGKTLHEAEMAIKNKVVDLDRAFLDAAPRNENSQTIYFRGMKTPFDFKRVGDKIIIKNFISVSSDINIAYRFSSLMQPDKCCLYFIKIAKGIPLINMINTTKFKNEKEILLPRELEFTLKDISQHKYHLKDVPVYHLECNMSKQNQFKIFNGCHRYTLCKISPSNLFTNKEKEKIKPPTKKQQVENIEEEIKNNPMHNIKRCPKGTRKNKKTGLCDLKNNNQKQITPKKISKDQNKTQKRCPNGTRKNKTTGLCEPK